MAKVCQAVLDFTDPGHGDTNLPDDKLLDKIIEFIRGQGYEATYEAIEYKE